MRCQFSDDSLEDDDVNSDEQIVPMKVIFWYF
jgi:hypothetical protein